MMFRSIHDKKIHFLILKNDPKSLKMSSNVL